MLDATWEDALSLRQRLTQLSAWGQAASQGEGDVSSLHATSKDTAKTTAKSALEEAKWANQGESRIIARPTQIKQANRRFVGPQLVSST